MMSANLVTVCTEMQQWRSGRAVETGGFAIPAVSKGCYLLMSFQLLIFIRRNTEAQTGAT
jgi:hypothetical protein